MEKTAIEYLIEQFESYDSYQIKLFHDEINTAKEMEKQQIRSAYIDGQDDIREHCKCKTEYHLNSLHYYQKKFNK